MLDDKRSWSNQATPAQGRMLGTMLAGIAEFERELTAERIRSGIAQGRSYRLVGREVGLSKNTVAAVVKRAQTEPAKR